MSFVSAAQIPARPLTKTLTSKEVQKLIKNGAKPEAYKWISSNLYKLFFTDGTESCYVKMTDALERFLITKGAHSC